MEEMPALPSAEVLEHMMAHAAEEAILHVREQEKLEQQRIEKLMAKLDLCVFIPVTIAAIIVIVTLRLSIGPEAGTLAMPAGYAVLRIFVGKKF